MQPRPSTVLSRDWTSMRLLTTAYDVIFRWIRTILERWEKLFPELKSHQDAAAIHALACA